MENKTLTKEQELMSLNGSFGMLAYLMQEIDNGELKTVDEIKNRLLSGMESIHEEMAKIEEGMSKSE
ncbi:hypothetical protein [Metabacillus fastidiosus]|uniref:hypothetical protein n=1 Tax=Metabacillus fastidiosus TaxID=1458 RepID=UPI003D2A41DF